MSFSNYLENKLLDHTFRNTSYTPPSALYVALSTAAPSDDGSTIAEPSGNNYARTAVTFGAASGGSISNSAQVQFPTASGSWGTITHFAIFDASSSGNMLGWGALTASQAVVSGNAPLFSAGQLTVTLD